MDESRSATEKRFIILGRGQAGSAKLNKHDPYWYMADVLQRLPTRRQSSRGAATASLGAGRHPLNIGLERRRAWLLTGSLAKEPLKLRGSSMATISVQIGRTRSLDDSFQSSSEAVSRFSIQQPAFTVRIIEDIDRRSVTTVQRSRHR